MREPRNARVTLPLVIRNVILLRRYYSDFSLKDGANYALCGDS